MEPEEYQADVADLTTHFQEHERQRLQLFPGEYAQVLRASQKDKQGGIKEAAQSPNGASHEAENAASKETLLLTGLSSSKTSSVAAT